MSDILLSLTSEQATWLHSLLQQTTNSPYASEIAEAIEMEWDVLDHGDSQDASEDDFQIVSQSLFLLLSLALVTDL